jgi:hypothetical protein
MNKRYEIYKTSIGSSTGNALLNHIIFSSSQTGEPAPLRSIGQQKRKLFWFRFCGVVKL